jgi:hypothetical protein
MQDRVHIRPASRAAAGVTMLAAAVHLAAPAWEALGRFGDCPQRWVILVYALG